MEFHYDTRMQCAYKARWRRDARDSRRGRVCNGRKHVRARFSEAVSEIRMIHLTAKYKAKEKTREDKDVVMLARGSSLRVESMHLAKASGWTRVVLGTIFWLVRVGGGSSSAKLNEFSKRENKPAIASRVAGEFGIKNGRFSLRLACSAVEQRSII